MSDTNNGREIIKAWITKYAMTKGVFVAESAEVCADISASMLKTADGHYYHGDAWHRTEEAAVKRAEEMRLAKIASLRKQIAKLEATRFTVVGRRS